MDVVLIKRRSLLGLGTSANGVVELKESSFVVTVGWKLTSLCHYLITSALCV